MQKKNKIFYPVLFVVLFAAIIYLFKRPILLLYRNLTESGDTQPLNLTTEQKLEDFEYLYEVISTSFPMLDDIKELHHLDFITDQEKYRELVTDSQDDYEFYCVMNYIVSNLPSAHTDIVFPDYDAYRGLGCYHLQDTLIEKGVLSSAYSWKELIKNQLDTYHEAEVEWFVFEYTSGKYLYSGNSDLELGAEIRSIDNVAPDEYIMQHPFVANKRRDFANSNPYVRKIVLNNCVGTPLTVQLQTSSGPETHIMYHDIFSEMAYYSAPHYEQHDKDKRLNYYVDEGTNTFFIQIDSFDNALGREFNGIIRRTAEYDNIIVDFRENSGGAVNFGTDYLYPKLFSSDTEMISSWYMLNSQHNQCVLRENILQTYFMHRFQPANDPRLSGGDYLSAARDIKYTGECDRQKNIYFLISDITASAADGFIAAVKDKDHVTVVGNNNTSGEGLANSFVVDCLPNSRLLLIYMYGKAFNEDGTDNSVYGTSPDYYISDTAEGFIEKNILMQNGEDPYTYENRLKWDNVLIETVEMASMAETAVP